MFKKLFGTDGIRGQWGDKITPELAFEIGKAVATIFRREGEQNSVIVGKDTRLSCDVLEASLISGITSMGTDVIKIGVVPTAVVPFSISYYKVNAAIMITASHNPASDNGFKFFNGNGFRISDEQESHIEHLISNSSDYALFPFDKLGRVHFSRASLNAYINMVKSELKFKKKFKILFDCANGSSSSVVKKIFKGYNCTFISSSPNGLNINDNCGATSMENIIEKMKTKKFDVGFSFDGDADRVRIVLGGGKVVSGEDIIYHLTKYNNFSSVVTTKMSNMALSNQLENEGIKCVVVDIGESAVINGLLQTPSKLGGENNGHFLLIEKGACSDGILVAAQILSIMEKHPKLDVPYVKYSQFEKAVKVKNKEDIIRNSFIREKIELCESLLAEKGRILVRASGTEEVIRILVEGEDSNLVEEIGREIEENILKLV